ncbi:hypothetical protein VNI00_006805 [Paramarasmius palmivorus]|uniref:Cilia- and flagella-associated protein 157 n=1 Tax=Paramarasmius palmivorus TaxID=297713 RepID=A0AAW0D6S0_9AGAR
MIMKPSSSPQVFNEELIPTNVDDNESITSAFPETQEPDPVDQIYLSLGKQTHKLMQSELSNDHLHRALADLRRKLAKTIAEKNRLQADVQHYKDTIDAFEEEVGELAEENTKLKEDVGELAEENARLKEDIGEQDAILRDLNEKSDALTEERAWRTEKDIENRELRKELKEKNEAMKALKRENEALNNALEEKNAAIEEKRAARLNVEPHEIPGRNEELKGDLVDQVKALIEVSPPDYSDEVRTLLCTVSSVFAVMDGDEARITRLEEEKTGYEDRQAKALAFLEDVSAPPSPDVRRTAEAVVQTTNEPEKDKPLFGIAPSTYSVKGFNFRFQSSPVRSEFPDLPQPPQNVVCTPDSTTPESTVSSEDLTAAWALTQPTKMNFEGQPVIPQKRTGFGVIFHTNKGLKSGEENIVASEDKALETCVSGSFISRA